MIYRRIFSAEFAKLLQNIKTRTPRVLLACSGGLDSMVLLHLCAQFFSQPNRKKSQLHVCYVDHRIRKDADKDIALIRHFCQSAGIAFTSRKLKKSSDLSEQTMRQERYRKLQTVAKAQKCAAILTAHHQTDQIETLLFRLFRGTHPSTLKGIYPAIKKEGLWILRPFLNFSRSEILEFAEKENLLWNEDSTNTQTHYARNYIRNILLPQIEEKFPQAGEHLLSFFKALSELENEKKNSNPRQQQDAALKNQIRLKLGAQNQRTTKAHWKSLDRALKTIQFPGGYSLIFKKDSKKNSMPRRPT